MPVRPAKDWNAIARELSSGSDSDAHDDLNVMSVQRNAHRVAEMVRTVVPGLGGDAAFPGMNRPDALREGLAAALAAVAPPPPPSLGAAQAAAVAAATAAARAPAATAAATARAAAAATTSAAPAPTEAVPSAAETAAPVAPPEPGK
jgi:hypothetical protein